MLSVRFRHINAMQQCVFLRIESDIQLYLHREPWIIQDRI